MGSISDVVGHYYQIPAYKRKDNHTWLIRYIAGKIDCMNYELTDSQLRESAIGQEVMDLCDKEYRQRKDYQQEFMGNAFLVAAGLGLFLTVCKIFW